MKSRFKNGGKQLQTKSRNHSLKLKRLLVCLFFPENPEGRHQRRNCETQFRQRLGQPCCHDNQADECAEYGSDRRNCGNHRQTSTSFLWNMRQ